MLQKKKNNVFQNFTRSTVWEPLPNKLQRVPIMFVRKMNNITDYYRSYLFYIHIIYTGIRYIIMLLNVVQYYYINIYIYYVYLR